jgi:arginyl-tRNA--protein-N-Asp/Glu arginylyltransferase
MENYIRLYENFLENEVCDFLVMNYKEIIQERPEEVKQKSLCQACELCHCTRMDIMQFSEFKDATQYVAVKLQSQVEVYSKDCNMDSYQLPKKYSFENIKIKRYLPNSPDQFKPHVDVGNYESAKRFLAFIVYLNDDFSGGETNILTYNKEIKPKKGSLLVFPPLWTHFHQGKPITSGNPKYILGSYLQYL